MIQLIIDWTREYLIVFPSLQAKKSRNSRHQFWFLIAYYLTLLIICLKKHSKLCFKFHQISLIRLHLKQQYIYQIHLLDAFQHRCVRCIMGVTHHQQWMEHITNESLLKDFGMLECLRWGGWVICAGWVILASLRSFWLVCWSAPGLSMEQNSDGEM